MTNKKHNILHYIKKFILVAAFLVGTVMLFNRPLTNFLIENYHPVIFKENAVNTKRAPYDWNDVKPLNIFTVIKARIYHPQIQVIGGIYNQKLGLDVPIVNGVDSTIYALCAGVLKPGQKMGTGNFTLAAHNIPTSKDALFTPIYNEAKIGDTLYVTNFKKVYSYRIYAKSSVSKYNQAILKDSKQPILTLITCGDTNNSNRVVFQAKLTKTASYNNVSPSTRAYLDEKYAVKDSRWDTIYLNVFNKHLQAENHKKVK